MLFCAYLDNNNNPTFWKEKILEHAAWLNLEPEFYSYSLSDNRTFYFCWLKQKSLELIESFKSTNEYLLLNTEGINIYKQEYSSLESAFNSNLHYNLIQIGVSSAKINISVPLTTQEPFYYSKNSSGYIFSNDMRLLIRLNNAINLDDIGVYALLKYFAVPAPFTIDKNINKIPNGYIFRLKQVQSEPEIDIANKIQQWIFPDIKIKSDSYENLIEKSLNNILEKTPESSIIYFSGGVDSALLAALFRDMGRSDIRLINCSFGQDDPAGQLAADVAKYINLPFEQIEFAPSRISMVLNNFARDYSFPFGDSASAPSNLLIKSSIDLFKGASIALTGVNADSAVGGGIAARYQIWKQIYQIPAFMRNILSDIYNKFSLWHFSHKLLKPMQIARLSTKIPIQYLSTGNIFEDIIYTVPEQDDRILDETIRKTLLDYDPTLNEQEKICLFNMVLTCANCNNALFFEPLRMQGIKSIDPYLEPDFIKTAFSIPWNKKCYQGKSKPILKNLLATKIPAELVYRSKKSFLSPFRDILSRPETKEFLEEIVFSQNNMILDFFNPNILRQIVRLTLEGRDLNYDAYNLLWTIMFASGWLSQINSEISHNFTVKGYSKEINNAYSGYRTGNS